MSGPPNATTDPQSGLRYYDWRGRRLLSVTSLRRVLGMPFNLAWWQVGQVIEASAKLRRDPLVADEKWAERLRKAATMQRDAAASLGTAVHDAASIGMPVADAPPEVQSRLSWYYNAMEELGITQVLAERQVFNLRLGYAGSFDLIGREPDGHLVCVDIKTGKGVYLDHALQLALYLLGEFVGQDGSIDQRATETLHATERAAILHVGDSGWEYIRVDMTHDLLAAAEHLALVAGFMASTDLQQLVASTVTSAQMGAHP